MKRVCVAVTGVLLALWCRQAVAQPTPTRPTLLVTLQLPLQGNADRLFRGKLQRAVDRLTTTVDQGGLLQPVPEAADPEAADPEAAEPSAGRKRPLLVIQFTPSRGGEATEFERAVGLARFLASESLAGVKTLAFLPESIEGHAVLVALSCEEIAMAPDARLGAAAVSEDPSRPVEPAVSAMYQQIAESRRTAPPAVVAAMVDRRAELVEAETDRGIDFLLREDLEEFRQDRVIIHTEVVSPAGELARFTGREGRELGFVRYLATDRDSLARTIGVPMDQLLEDLSIEGSWRPIMVDLEGPVTTKSARRLQTLIGSEIEKGANWVGVRIQSSGGEWPAALSIARTLAELADGEARTVAYVPQRAEGPAALVALACDQLVMQSEAKLGGIEQPQAGPAPLENLNPEDGVDDDQGPEEEPDQPDAEEDPAPEPGLRLGAGPQAEPDPEAARAALDQLIATLRDSLAAQAGRSWSLLAATADNDLELALYANRQTGARRFFSPAELEQQLDSDAWRQVELVKRAGEPLRLASDRAFELGIAWREVEQFDDLATLYGFAEPPPTAEPNWALELVEALASPGFAAMLLVVGIVGVYLELNTPGLGIGGFIATVAFLLFFWSKYLDGTADWLEVILFVTGVVFLLLEVFVLPGFGVFGLGGMLMVISALVLASQTFVLPKTETQLVELRNSLALVTGSGLACMVIGVALRQYLPHSPLFKRVTLQPLEEADLIEQQRREALANYEHLIGATGAAVTDLLPGGRAEINGEILDVVTRGEVIDSGESIEVVSAHANRVLVRRVRA